MKSPQPPSSRQALLDLYQETSKHSSYQALAPVVEELLGVSPEVIRPHYEKERLEYILKNVDFQDQRVVDVGGNTGFFSFEALSHGAACVTMYEGNQAHAEFARLCAQEAGLDSRLTVCPRYFDFNTIPTTDICLLLNVLHHTGDDYHPHTSSIGQAKEDIIRNLKLLAEKARTVVFQLGYCWKGNRDLLLFADGTKQEQIDFLNDGIRDVFDIVATGAAKGSRENARFADIDDESLVRRDDLGEFLNRPLFILRSRVIS